MYLIKKNSNTKANSKIHIQSSFTQPDVVLGDFIKRNTTEDVEEIFISIFSCAQQRKESHHRFRTTTGRAELSR